MEDIFHFLRIFLLLIEIRVSTLGRRRFSRTEVLHLINGEDFGNLYKHVKGVMRYSADNNLQNQFYYSEAILSIFLMYLEFNKFSIMNLCTLG